MKVVITGGGGFLGSMLCEQLLGIGELTGPSGRPETILEIVLLDAAFRQTSADPRVKASTVDISDRDAVMESVGTGAEVSIFHLASMVSGECELRFDDALRVNLDGGRNVFEAARRAEGQPRVVFASSIACFGGDEIPDHFSDSSKPLPRTTYGMTKTICELMVNDYSRKRFIDGRSARLPTVSRTSGGRRLPAADPPRPTPSDDRLPDRRRFADRVARDRCAMARRRSRRGASRTHRNP
jgi:nucleoside-diphosphate-sugar epimerase